MRWPVRSMASRSMRAPGVLPVAELLGHHQEILSEGGNGVSEQPLDVVALVEAEVGEGRHGASHEPGLGHLIQGHVVQPGVSSLQGQHPREDRLRGTHHYAATAQVTLAARRFTCHEELGVDCRGCTWRSFEGLTQSPELLKTSRQRPRWE